MVLFIHRPEYYKITQDENGNSLLGIAEIIIAKHRNGSTDDIRLKFTKEFIKFENIGENTNDFSEFQSKVSRTNENDFLTESNIGLPPQNDYPF